MKKGSMVLVPEMDTQLGRLTADEGHELLSVFLGSVPIGEDPDPAGRLYSLGWRQMAMYVVAYEIQDPSLGHRRNGSLLFSCLGAFEAAEAGVRHALRVAGDNELAQIRIGLHEIGPIDEDGVEHTSDTPPFFGWSDQMGCSIEDQITRLKDAIVAHTT